MNRVTNNFPAAQGLCNLSHSEVSGEEKFLSALSWRQKCSGEGRPDLGIVLRKQDEASAVENKVPSLYYTLY